MADIIITIILTTSAIATSPRRRQLRIIIAAAFTICIIGVRYPPPQAELRVAMAIATPPCARP
jgi:hypothetical protein